LDLLKLIKKLRYRLSGVYIQSKANVRNAMNATNRTFVSIFSFKE